MSLDRSPSPQRGGGWSSPGLATAADEASRSRGGSPARRYGELNGDYSSSWASAKEKAARVKGNPRYQSSNQGFFTRHMRNISESLPRFASGSYGSRYAEKEKLGRGRAIPWTDLPRRMLLLLTRRRKFVALFMLMILVLLVLGSKPLRLWYRRHPSFGGGSKFVVILGANVGGGVMEWKGAREWAIERDSVRNKKAYAAEWGYELEIVDMATKKRYAHEWRESWEKVDTMRNALKKYPDAEWFWWLDLNTFIMEPSISLQEHIFNDLGKTAYRDINIYNPLKISHPPNGTSADKNSPQYVNYLDEESTSAVGDGKPESLNLLVPQDCGGFNLGSWFLRRSDWSEQLLDIWWDPVFYEQKHMEWEHKEQDALEYIYTNQPWVRPHVGFLPQRKINAFPPQACGDDRGIPAGGCGNAEEGGKHECGVQGIHYQEKERDFLVNMAGCEWGRDCWAEMYAYRQKSRWLNRTLWEKFKDGISGVFKSSKKGDEGKKQ